MADQIPRRGSKIPRSFWIRALYSFILTLSVLILGTLAMHSIEGWSYLDAFYFTSFIATGQGPPANLNPLSPFGKIFASFLAFISVCIVIAALLFLFGPFLGELARVSEKKLEKIEREIEGKDEKKRRD